MRHISALSVTNYHQYRLYVSEDSDHKRSVGVRPHYSSLNCPSSCSTSNQTRSDPSRSQAGKTKLRVHGRHIQHRESTAVDSTSVYDRQPLKTERVYQAKDCFSGQDHVTTSSQHISLPSLTSTISNSPSVQVVSCH